MDFNYYSKNILVTMQEDDNSPIVASAKAVAPLNLAGAFMRPVQNNISHTVVNNASLDVEMYMDVQAVLMSPAFVRQVFIPLLSGQAEAISRLAATS